MKRLFPLLAALLALFLVACGGMPKKKVDMVAEYAHAVRWSDWDSAWKFIDAGTRTAMNLPDDELARLKDVKVTGYEVRSRDVQPDGTIAQVVEIRYIDQATQVERSTRDRQVWKTDDGGEHWWNTTGLPQFPAQ